MHIRWMSFATCAARKRIAVASVRHRFYDSKSAAGETYESFERRERLPYQIMTVTLIAVALLIFWVFLRFIDLLH